MLDGALAAQQFTYIAAEYSLPLLFLKLDITAALDSIEHPAIAFPHVLSAVSGIPFTAKVHSSQRHRPQTRTHDVDTEVAQRHPSGNSLFS